VPLSEYKGEYTLSPEKDLIPVCPNCHLMIHCKNEPFKIEELKRIINNIENNS
jgi:5-methylcytosine-specific restriction protein A